ncbi:Nitric oxide reductase activation protein NorE [gamma proteobacterium IMCC2047]|nr:Nitric oxide reductase activation protein NorE [gamma proteobacterium IMCC2047]
MLYQAITQGESEQRPTPANIAVWVLIWAELTEFALFFLVYLVVRSHNPELFSEGPKHLNTLAGALNTLVLLTSSYCVARAMAGMRAGRPDSCMKWLTATLAMGLTYCGIKAWEYVWNDAAGLDSRTDLFYSLYYYLTFNHLLHVLVGMCTITWAMFRVQQGAFSAESYEGLEGAACYWHMIDLAWIIIFPLLYVLR